MAPDTDDFLARYLALIDDSDPAVVFGGFSMKQVPKATRFALHRALALRGECLDAAERRLKPEKYVSLARSRLRGAPAGRRRNSRALQPSKHKPPAL